MTLYMGKGQDMPRHEIRNSRLVITTSHDPLARSHEKMHDADLNTTAERDRHLHYPYNPQH